MESFDTVRKYKEEVCKQIRWKKVHEVVSVELENHILDQRDSYIMNGEDESAALDRAIKEMGDPVIVGTELDRTHRPKPQKAMLAFTFMLLSFGLLLHMFFMYDNDHSDELIMQVLAISIGIGLMLLAYYGDFTMIGKSPKIVLIITSIMMILILAMPKRMINGRHFFVVSTFLISGAYLTLIFPLVLVTVIYTVRNKGYLGIVLTEAALLIMMLLVSYFSTLGNALTLLITGLILITVAIIRGWYSGNKVLGCILLYVTILLGVFLILMISSMPYIYYMERISLFINPAKSPKGYMAVTLRELLHNSSFIGHGNTPEIYESMPFSLKGFDTDYLLTYLIVNYGWITFYIIVAVIAAFLIKGFYQSLKQRSLLGLLVSLAVMFTLTFETISYIAWNLGFMMVSPISLPLISYGNTALIINLFLIGMMLSVFRNGEIVRDGRSSSNSAGLIHFKDGCLTIDFRNREVKPS